MTELDEELAIRLAAALSIHARRRRLRAEARAAETAGRAQGKALGHAARLRRSRATNPQEESTMPTVTAQTDPPRCIVADCLEEPPRDVLICRTHAAALTPITATAPAACGCLLGQPCPQHGQAGQGRGRRYASRGRS